MALTLRKYGWMTAAGLSGYNVRLYMNSEKE